SSSCAFPMRETTSAARSSYSRKVLAKSLSMQDPCTISAWRMRRPSIRRKRKKRSIGRYRPDWVMRKQAMHNGCSRILAGANSWVKRKRPCKFACQRLVPRILNAYEWMESLDKDQCAANIFSQSAKLELRGRLHCCFNLSRLYRSWLSDGSEQHDVVRPGRSAEARHSGVGRRCKINLLFCARAQSVAKSPRRWQTKFAAYWRSGCCRQDGWATTKRPNSAL